MLKNTTIKFYEVVNGEAASSSIQDLINNLIEENDLESSDKVPTWLLRWMNGVINQETINRTSYRYDPSQGDISNFIAELEDLINADWNDYGEAVEVKFTNLGIQACISTEGNFYEISKM